jgi:hypothetical protein
VAYSFDRPHYSILFNHYFTCNQNHPFIQSAFFHNYYPQIQAASCYIQYIESEYSHIPSALSHLRSASFHIPSEQSNLSSDFPVYNQRPPMYHQHPPKYHHHTPQYRHHSPKHAILIHQLLQSSQCMESLYCGLEQPAGSSEE